MTSSPAPENIMVLIGASNLSLALATALHESHNRVGDGQTEFFAAHGPGRSYGIDAGVMGVSYRGHRDTHLCETLQQRHEAHANAPIYALLTDVGNDLMYEVDPDELLGWVDHIVTQLRNVGATVGVTLLPEESVKRMSATRFLFLRTMYFPRCRLSFAEVLKRIGHVNNALQALSTRHKFQCLDVNADWYGLDRFHIRRRHQQAAFSLWLDALVGPATEPETSLQLPSCVGFRKPEHFRFLGTSQRGTGHHLLGAQQQLFLF